MDHLFFRLMRYMTLSLTGLLVVGHFLASRSCFSDEPVPEVKGQIAELTERINEFRRATASDPFVQAELAQSYMTRAKLYLFAVKDFSRAESDFSRTIDLLTATSKSAQKDLPHDAALAEGHLFRARSRMKLNQLELANLDASSSIKFYQRLAGQNVAFESNLVYALKTRIEVARQNDKRDAAQTRQLDNDLTTATKLLEKLSKQGFNDEFYQEQLSELRQIRDEISLGGQAEASNSAVMPSENHPATKFAARSPSDFPLGAWINAKEYRNNFALPLKVHLKGRWARALPPGADFHVVRKDGMATLNHHLPLKTEHLDRAFVLWMESLVIDERTLLGIELHGLREGEKFQDFTVDLMKKVIQDESQKPEVLYEPFSRFHQVIIAGRNCWQLDIDIFRESGIYTRRNIYVPAGDVVYDIGWAMTEPRLRAALDDEFDLMIQIGAPFQESPEDDVQAQQILSVIGEAQKRSTRLIKLKAELMDALDIQGAAISRVQAFLNDTRGGTPFGFPRRTGNSAGAITALQSAKQWQGKIDQLMAQRLQLRREVIQDALSGDQKEHAKMFFPGLFRTLPAHRDEIQEKLFTPEDNQFEVDAQGLQPEITSSVGAVRFDFFLDKGYFRIARKRFPENALKLKPNIDAVLIDFGDTLKSGQPGRLLKEEFSEVGGHRAREFSWEVQNNDGGVSRVTAALTIAEEFLYLILTNVHDVSDAAQIERADRFFQSFQIHSATSAKVVPSQSVPKSDGNQSAADTFGNAPPAGSRDFKKPDVSSTFPADSHAYAVGQNVDVLWENSWYPAEVVKVVGEQQWEIHYDGYSSDWNEVVGISRIRLRKSPDPTFRPYGAEQLIGPPNTMQPGDFSTAWASKTSDSSTEWILVEYEDAISIKEIAIYETYNPGAVTKVSAIDSTGAESVVWTAEVDRSVSELKRILRVDLEKSIETKLLKIYIDSPRVGGWNEIDTVAIRDKHGELHWPIRADASSSYASGNTPRQLKALVHKK